MANQNLEERTEQQILAQREAQAAAEAQAPAEAPAQAQAADTPAPAEAPAAVAPVLAGPGITETTLPSELTFAQALQKAVSLFTQNVSALKALDSGVIQAGDEEADARVALTEAQHNETAKINQQSEGLVSATDSRDALVKVLQDWNPE